METSKSLRRSLRERKHDLEFAEYRVNDLVMIPEFFGYEIEDRLMDLEQRIHREVHDPLTPVRVTPID